MTEVIDATPRNLLTLADLDRRTRPYRRYESVVGAIMSDLGGEDALSEAQRQLVDKAAFLALRLEMMTAESLAGGDTDMPLYGALADRLRRLLESLGLKRVPREVPDLQTYLAAKAAAREAS